MVVAYQYGYVLPVGMGVLRIGGGGWSLSRRMGPMSVDALSEDLLAYCRVLHAASDPVTIAAHSFGTLLAVGALARADFDFDRILLAASCIDPDYDWSGPRVRAVRHEYSPTDPVIGLVPLGEFLNANLWRTVPADLGASGIAGFTRRGGVVQEQEYVTRNHSAFVMEEHILDNWIPFFCEVDFKAVCRRCLKGDRNATAAFLQHYFGFVSQAIGEELRAAGKARLTIDETRYVVLKIWSAGADRSETPSRIIRTVVRGYVRP